MKKLYFVMVNMFLFVSCSPQNRIAVLTVGNPLPFERAHETVELAKDFLNADDLSKISIRDKVSAESVVSQFVDSDGDGEMDLLLFQPRVPANSKNGIPNSGFPQNIVLKNRLPIKRIS